jgi:RNA polymerase sigma factor (sigma-70 family)
MSKSPNECTVEELVVAARSGDTAALAELVYRYDGMVHAIAMTYRLQPADVADAVQNTWLHAVERLGALREPERFGGWLRTIANRECLTVRTQGRRVYLDERLDEHVVDAAPGPEALLVQAETVRAVRAAVGSLTGRNRVLVETLFYCTRDYTLVAQTAGMPIGSIGPTRARALNALRLRLERDGFAPRRAAVARAG